MSWVVSIDFGTSFSTAAIHDESSSTVEIVDLDGTREVPSGIWLDDKGTLVVGTAAMRQARLAPDRWVRAPKRFLGDPAPLLLGGQDIPVVNAVAEVLKLLATEAIRRRGDLPDEVRLTYPARWGAQRQNALRIAAQLGGLGSPPLAREPRLVSEPVAAALYFARQGQLPTGAIVAVYDLGGGTFDSAVLQALPDGMFSILSLGGIDGLGGELFDDLLFQHVGEVLTAQRPQAWTKVVDPPDRQWARAGQTLFQHTREAKEDLSRYPSARIDTGPLIGVEDLELTREDTERLLRPKITESAHELSQTITRADLRPTDLHAIYLAGGSSRMPLVSHVITDILNVPCEVLGEPKSVVVVGAAQWRPETVISSSALSNTPTTQVQVESGAPIPTPTPDPAYGRPEPRPTPQTTLFVPQDEPMAVAPVMATAQYGEPTTQFTDPYQAPPPYYPPGLQRAPSTSRKRVLGWSLAGMGVVVMVVAVIVVLLLIPDRGRSPGLASSTSTTTTTSEETVDLQDQLISMIPDGLVDRSSCEETTYIPAASASVSCSPARIEPSGNPLLMIDVHLFDSQAEMEDNFLDGGDTGGCGPGWNFGEEPIGQFACALTAKDNGYVAWSYDDQLVTIYAIGTNDDIEALDDWWLSAYIRLNCPEESSDGIECA